MIGTVLAALAGCAALIAAAPLFVHHVDTGPLQGAQVMLRRCSR